MVTFSKPCLYKVENDLLNSFSRRQQIKLSCLSWNFFCFQSCTYRIWNESVPVLLIRCTVGIVIPVLFIILNTKYAHCMNAKWWENWSCKCSSLFNSRISNLLWMFTVKIKCTKIFFFRACTRIIYKTVHILTRTIETDIFWTWYKDREWFGYIWNKSGHNQYVWSVDLKMSDESELPITTAIIHVWE